MIAMDLNTGIWIAIVLIVLSILIGNFIVYQKLATMKTTSFKLSFVPLLTLTTSPFIVLILPIFIVYRQIINLMLFLRYRSKYCGLLEGRDAVYNIENKNPVHILFIVRYASNSSQNFYDAVKSAMYEVLAKKGDTNPKIFGAVRTFMGYSYILKNEITFENCFQKLKITNCPITKDDLLQILGENTSLPLPKNRQALWDVFVGAQPVKWTEHIEGDNVEHYPVVFRMNHTFADAGHFLRGFVEFFDNKKKIKVTRSSNCIQSEETELNQSFSIASISRFLMNLGRKLILYARKLCVLVLLPSVGLVNSLVMVSDVNSLHGPKPTYRKHLFLSVEETPHYVQVVKRIKKKIPGCTFEDVWLTAIAASFTEYFQKNSLNIPEYIVTEVPAVPRGLVKPEKPKVGKIPCCNRLTVAVRKLPINVDLKNPNARTNLLQTIGKEGFLITQSVEYEVTYLILTVVCHFIPAPLLRPLFDIVHNYTVLISNVPGPRFITVMNDCPIQAIVPWTATRGYTGIGFTIFTYDDRLQLSMIVDKSLATNRNDVQSLIDGVYKHLNLLEHEVMNIADKNA